MSSDDILVVLCTTDSAESAAGMARELVGRQLAACVNVIPGVRSFYRWQGEIAEDGEHLLVIKTRAARLEEARTCIRELHPYDLPEVIALPVQDGDGDYLDWVRQSTEDVTT